MSKNCSTDVGKVVPGHLNLSFIKIFEESEVTGFTLCTPLCAINHA